MTSSNNIYLLNQTTALHKKLFDSIGSKIYKDGTNVAYFINSFLGDYVYDINTYVKDNLADELDRYWNGNVNSYCSQLQREMGKARNSIITAFLLYYDISELETYTEDEINDSTLDLYLGIGPEDIFNNPDLKRLNKLSQIQLSLLNKYLQQCNFQEITIE